MILFSDLIYYWIDNIKPFDGLFVKIALIDTELTIQSMRVLEFPSIRPSSYRRKQRKCWSQIALAPMGEKHLFGPAM